MQKSTETRWMLTLEDAAIAEKWFEIYGEKFENKESFPRQDFYLKTNSVSIGIKIREPKKDTDGNIIAKLELKTLTQDFGNQIFENNNAGAVNSWVKYSFDLDKSKNPLDLIHFPNKKINEEWVLIEKNRILVKYNANKNIIVPSTDIINSGAGIELTKLIHNNKIYYSLGVEAFSELENTEVVFYKSISYLFKNLKINNLKFKNSKTYPELLLKI